MFPDAELSMYELHRKPHEVITDQTIIGVSPRALHSELMCPICLDLMKNTLTTKEVSLSADTPITGRGVKTIHVVRSLLRGGKVLNLFSASFSTSACTGSAKSVLSQRCEAGKDNLAVGIRVAK